MGSITKPRWNASASKLGFQRSEGVTNGSGTLNSMALSLSPLSSGYDRSNKSIVSVVALIKGLLIDRLSQYSGRLHVLGLSVLAIMMWPGSSRHEKEHMSIGFMTYFCTLRGSE